ncbi:MAG: hypothetical protein V7642_6204 [Burkholderiales bacterium]|jgi:beta-carotene hydroxylase
MLRYRQDIRSLAFVALTIAALLAPHSQHMQGMLLGQPFACVPWIFMTGVLCFIASVINHNHMHSRMFRLPALNLLLNVALSLARGHTASGIIVPHHYNHHAEASSPEDWIRPQLAGSGLGWIRLGRFVVTASLNMMVRRTEQNAPALPARMRRSQQFERTFLIAAVGIAFLHDWWACLIFNVVPWLLGLAMLVGVNLLQHDDCLPDLPYGESRNFTGPIGNWLFFNNGYHTAHHNRPSLHWSKLPQRHAILAARLPRPDLEQSSILSFLWHFGWHRTPAAVAYSG